MEKYRCCDGTINSDHLLGEKCKINKSCVNWYSTEHHRVFCSLRFEVLQSINSFLPKLDQDLLPRFFESMEIDEKYAICMSSSATVNFLKPIKVMDSFSNKILLPKSKVVVANNLMELKKTDLKKNKKFFHSITSKKVICLPRILKISNSCLSGEILLQILSTYTKTFQMYHSSCNPNISFTDIIKKAPNLQEICFYDFETNIIYEETWIENLIKYKNGKNFEHLNLKLDVLKLDAKYLAKFVKEKCSKTANIDIRFNQNLEDPSGEGDNEGWEIFNEIKKESSEYFDECIYYEDRRLQMCFDGGDSDGDAHFSLRKIKTPSSLT